MNVIILKKGSIKNGDLVVGLGLEVIEGDFFYEFGKKEVFLVFSMDGVGDGK